ncbi:MAG TPA: hypothetical protein ENJ06_05390 [Phycisphaeraceae bacterium]|nr:hypothetical protein [Phycisphaeraceae bacterium]
MTENGQTDDKQEIPDHQHAIPEVSPRRHPVMLALNLLGYAIGLLLMAYCVRTAVRDEAPRLLASAGLLRVATLLLLSLISVLAHGATWWLLMLPVKRLIFTRVEAINAIASLLFYAPAKLSVISRAGLHRKMDGLSFPLIAAWFVAGSICMGIPFLLVLFLTMTGEFNPLLRSVVVLFALGGGVAGAVFLARRRVVARLLKGSERMLIHPGIVSGAVLLRFIDLTAMSLRLQVSCDVMHQPISLQQAYTLTIMPLLGSVVSPIGALGAREWLTGVLGEVLHSSGQEIFQNAATIATASEAAVLLVLSLIALVYLKPHRYLK